MMFFKKSPPQLRLVFLRAASKTTRAFLHCYTSLESFLKAKWQMMRPPATSKAPTHVYEVRPRADHAGVDLISDVLPYSPLWHAGPNAISNAKLKQDRAARTCSSPSYCNRLREIFSAGHTTPAFAFTMKLAT